MKRLFLLTSLILSFFSLIFASTAFAQETNKFGIHILEPADLEKASELINSTGGDWGWVTVVIREDDLNSDKWQDFFNQCRIKHLIPLVRIATHLEGSNWAKPKVEDSQKWADFLGSLNWPEKDQYVIIFNEPNHKKEWGGEVNPGEYAKILEEFSNKFKSKNPNLKILNAGFDLAAPNGNETMDAFHFWSWMKATVPDIFEKLDGWTSHSYPNHGFVGKPWENSRTSIHGYDWELSILKNQFGLKKELPVFITETGWPKNNLKFVNEVTASEYLKYAFENVWLKDERIKSVTPFVLNYPDDLFAAFSWLDKDGNPYQQFIEIKNLVKRSWWPEQIEKYEMKSLLLPSFMPVNTTFKGKITLKNIGQSIWGEKGEWQIENQTPLGLKVSNIILPPNIKVLPGETTQIDFTITTASQSGDFELSWGKLPKQKLKVLPASIITSARYTFWEKILLKIRSIF